MNKIIIIFYYYCYFAKNFELYDLNLQHYNILMHHIDITTQKQLYNTKISSQIIT